MRLKSRAEQISKKKRFLDALYHLFTYFFYVLTELVLEQQFNEAPPEWMELFIDD